MKFTILVIDDEENIRNGLASNFEMEDYTVRTASNGRQGLELVSKGDIDLVVTDLRMDGISGEEVLRRVTTETPGIPVIVLTGHGSIDAAVDAMKNGAYDFLTKPLNLDQLNAIVKRALETRELSLKHKMLLSELDTVHSFGKMIGKSAEIQKVFNLVEKVAPSKASVLITGESGVGKELVADAIHSLSPRKNNSFIKVHCAALSESLLESELFGHEKGAYTGADSMKKGRFELAHGGTIFLDEIGEINQSTQIKLLRVLQEKKFERVGGDVRIVLGHARLGVDHEHDDVRVGDGLQRLHDRKLLNRLEDPALFAQARRVDERVGPAVVVEVDVDRIARGAGHVIGDDALLAQQRVHKGGLADVRAPRDGDPHAPGAFFLRLGLPGALRLLPGLRRKPGEHIVHQRADALAVGGGDEVGLAYAQLIELGRR